MPTKTERRKSEPKKPDPLGAPLTILRRLSAALPGAEEYVMVHHPAFRVGKKPFAIVGMDQAPTLSINLGPEAQLDLLTDQRFSRTHYIGQHGWVTVDYAALSTGEVASLVEGSWQRIAGKKHLAAHASAKTPGKGAAPQHPPKAPSAAGKASARRKPSGAAKKASANVSKDSVGKPAKKPAGPTRKSTGATKKSRAARA